MARMAYTPMPVALNRDERLTAAKPALRLTYLCLRIGSDSWGRFPADSMALRLVSGILDPALDVSSLFAELVELGLIVSWSGADGCRYAEIVGYDAALTANMIRRRGMSEIDKPEGLGRVTHESVTSEEREPPVPAPSLTHESVTSESGSSLPSRARPNQAEPSRTEPSSHTQRARETKPGNQTSDPPPLVPQPEALSPPAIRWLQRRVEVSKRYGHSFATLGEADDLCGAELRRLQAKPGFADCVSKMLALPDQRWGKRLSSGVPYLARMVADWIEPEKGNGSRQRHLVPQPLSVSEYRERTGIDPASAPVDTSEEARSVMEAIGAPA